MKRMKFVIAGSLALLVAACSLSPTIKAEKENCADGWYKTVQLEVLKVFFAKEGDAIYKAYLVKWKDQEVIINDSLARTDYNIGDIITLVAMALPSPYGEGNSDLLSFEIVPPKNGGSQKK